MATAPTPPHTIAPPSPVPPSTPPPLNFENIANALVERIEKNKFKFHEAEFDDDFFKIERALGERLDLNNKLHIDAPLLSQITEANIDQLKTVINDKLSDKGIDQSKLNEYLQKRRINVHNHIIEKEKEDQRKEQEAEIKKEKSPTPKLPPSPEEEQKEEYKGSDIYNYPVKEVIKKLEDVFDEPEIVVVVAPWKIKSSEVHKNALRALRAGSWKVRVYEESEEQENGEHIQTIKIENKDLQKWNHPKRLYIYRASKDLIEAKTGKKWRSISSTEEKVPKSSKIHKLSWDKIWSETILTRTFEPIVNHPDSGTIAYIEEDWQ